ncbi:unnamed protein product, partial [Hapterophycus canaliculatus]
MAEMKTSTRPLPSGWSDSSDDVRGGGGGGGGGGGAGDFDGSSSDGDWGRGGGRRTGGGIRQFERSSAENTRRALLHNDEQLCEPPSWGAEHEPSLSSAPPSPSPPPPPPPASLRYVPGDPFANEEADVGAWAEHFTYLSVVPAGGGAGSAAGKGRDRGDGGIVEMEEEGEEREAEGGGAATERCAQDEGARVQGMAAVAAVAPEAAADRPREQRLRDRGQEEEEEEVFASHGVYEEYLAYDCRPPDDERYAHSEYVDSSGGMFDAGVGGQGAKEGAEGASIALGEQGATVVEPGGQLPPAAAVTATKGLPRLDTPRRELREEIMDRLFDELWARLTPDLVLLLQQQR